jgi:hypothetical protein
MNFMRISESKRGKFCSLRHYDTLYFMVLSVPCGRLVAAVRMKRLTCKTNELQLDVVMGFTWFQILWNLSGGIYKVRPSERYTNGEFGACCTTVSARTA